jgi:signal transduction histidine kinase
MKEEAFNFLLENVPAALFVYRHTPQGTSTVDYLSPACLSIWEVPSEVAKKNSEILWQMIHSEDFQGMQNSVLLSAQELSLWDWKWRIVMPNGSVKWLHGRGTPKREANGDVAWFTFIFDITKEKVLEQTSTQLQLALFENQKYESASHLVAGFTHDINNYLAIISSSVGLINLKSPLNEKGKELILRCQNAVRESAELTRSLLGYINNHSENQELVNVSVCLNALNPLIHAALPNRIQFHLKIDSSDCQFMGQATLFQSTIMNMVLNARDAIDETGEISILVFEEKDQVVLVIQDTGRGMTDLVLKKCLEPFFTTKEKQTVTGLGLYMVDQFVKKMSGQLIIQSELNKGTRIEMRLPLSVNL